MTNDEPDGYSEAQMSRVNRAIAGLLVLLTVLLTIIGTVVWIFWKFLTL